LKSTDFTLNGANGTVPRLRVADAALSVSYSESAADRFMLTLLALGLMLLAFFVVLTSSSSVDQQRAQGVVQSVQAAFERSAAEVVVQAPAVDQERLAAVGILRAAVADIFAQVISVDPNARDTETANAERVEVDVPISLFFADGTTTLNDLPMLDKIAAVVKMPPAGYRMEIVVRAAVKQSDIEIGQGRVAALAMDLMQRGVPVTMLSVGTLDEIKASDERSPTLRFTFLLLNEDDNLAGVRALTEPVAAQVGP